MAAAVVAPAMDDSNSGDGSPTRRVLFKELDKLGVPLPCAFAAPGVLSCYIQVCT